MPWFISHAIFYTKVKQGTQDEIPVWENVYLIEADTEEEANIKAVKVAKEDETYTKEVFYDNRPALQLFKGIRKVIGSTDPLSQIKLVDGEEITYSQFVVKSEEDVARLANGDNVILTHVE